MAMPQQKDTFRHFKEFFKDPIITTVETDVQKEHRQKEMDTVISSAQRFATEQDSVMSELGDQVFGHEVRRRLCIK